MYSDESIYFELLNFLTANYTHVIALHGGNSFYPHGQFKQIIVAGSKQFIYNPSQIQEIKNTVYGYISYDYHYENRIINDFSFSPFFFFEPELVFDFSNEIDKKKAIQLLAIQNSKLQGIKHSSILSTNIFCKNNYVENFDILKKEIKIGNIYEINYCFESFGAVGTINPVYEWQLLVTKSKAPFASFIKQNEKFVLCASPERFLKNENGTLVSQPIKGTASRNSDQNIDFQNKTDLQNSEKERIENIMIVDLVRNDLSKIVGSSLVKVEELCKIYSFENIHQMISTITAQIEKTDFVDILDCTFPMGSMTGAPKIKAMELIEQHEHFSRGLFSGSIGYIEPNGNFDLNVVIRTVFYHSILKKISILSGSAITNLSDPESEWNECIAKKDSILNYLSFSSSIV